MDSTLSNTTVGPSTGLANAGTPASPQTLGNNITAPATINASALSAKPVSIPTPPPSVAPPPGFVPTTGAIQQGAQTGTAIQQPTQAPTSPAQPTNPVSQANAQNTGLITGNPQGLSSQDQLAQNTANAQETYDQTTQQINQLMQELGMQSTDVGNMQNSVGISGLQTNLSDLNNQLAQAKANYATQTQQIGSQNIPSLFVTGQQAIARAAANSNIGALSAQVQAAQGNLTTAFNTINQTISEKYKPIQDQLTAQETFLKDNYDQLTAQQKIQAQGVQDTIAAQKANILNEQAIVKTASSTIQDAVTKLGLDPSVAIKAIGELASGTKTLDDISKELGIAFNSDGSSSAVPTEGAGSGATNVAASLGLQNTTLPLSQVIQQFGIDNVVAGIIQNEGGSTSGTLNNPGNIKYYDGLPNATKGPAAPDGGNYANFDSKADGTAAIANLVQSAASGSSSIYGQNPTFQDFMNKYTNTAPTSTASTPSYQQYGLLANTDFNPQSKTDSYAQQYLNTYLKNAEQPTAQSLGLSARGGNIGAMSATTILQNAQKRASDLYYQATGQQLPNLQVLQANNKLVTSNNNLLNQLNVQTGTIQKNFGLSLENLTQNNINSTWPVVNNMLNSLAAATGNSSVAQYISQNKTVSNELASLLSIKNASGTTVGDKLSAQDVLPSGATVPQMQAILGTLMKEANNQSNTINQTNAGLYKSVDPLEQDQNNPNKLVETPGGNQVPQMTLDSAKSNNFNLDQAIKDGHSLDEIQSYLQSLYS